MNSLTFIMVQMVHVLIWDDQNQIIFNVLQATIMLIPFTSILRNTIIISVKFSNILL